MNFIIVLYALILLLFSMWVHNVEKKAKENNINRLMNAGDIRDKLNKLSRETNEGIKNVNRKMEELEGENREVKSKFDLLLEELGYEFEDRLISVGYNIREDGRVRVVVDPIIKKVKKETQKKESKKKK